MDDAHRTPERVAAVDASRIFQRDEDINRLKRSPTASVVLPLPGAQTRSLEFLKEWFEARGGKLTILKRDEMHVLLRVDRLRSEVISHERYWEYLKVNLILVDDQPKLRMYLMSDGYYAPGVGSNVPPDDSFSDMEHSYYKNLSEYTEALATRIENRLRGQP